MDSEKKKELPKRKHPRLKTYDYSSPGAYFVTICTENKRCILSNIVGRGLAPAEQPVLEYTILGKTAEAHLLALEKRYQFLKIDKYVIMPNHIHAILIFDENAAGASPRPTLTDIICAFKSLTTIECRKSGFAGKLFQTSFYEHIINGHNEYGEIYKYIHENPMNWQFDELYWKE